MSDHDDTEGVTPEDIEAGIEDLEAAANGEPAEGAREAEAEEAKTPEAELEELTADLKRVSAEFANYRKRAERDRQATVVAAKASVAALLLPMADDFDLAAQHGDLAEGSALKAFADKFTKVIEDLGVEKFGQAGEAFNPDRHEAVQDMSTGDEKVLGTILRSGYAMGDRVLRTAMVIISDPEPGAETGDEDQE